MSTIHETIHALEEYNKWRRGDDTITMPDPFEVGVAIGDAVRLLREHAAITARAEKAEAELATEREKVRVLRELLQTFVDYDQTPAPNCSCHIAPPCNDCVDNAGARELVGDAKAALAATKENQCLNQMNSTKINYGGPAFPHSSQPLDAQGNPMCGEHSEWGMTLRDYFMAHAPNIPDSFERKSELKEVHVPAPEAGRGWVKCGTRQWVEDDLTRLVRWRTTYADAMIAARKEVTK